VRDADGVVDQRDHHVRPGAPCPRRPPRAGRGGHRLADACGGERLPAASRRHPDARRQALYFEFASLAESERTLESLSTSLFGASLVTTIAGFGLGWWASRRTLRPLADVSTAAEAIAGGRLDTRLGAIDDPDLGVLVSSFNHMAQVLEERIEQDNRFASDVSHELRSPLMTLSASIEVLSSRREEMPDASAQAAVDLMVADMARFKQLVEDLLEISRFDAGAARLELSELRPGELVPRPSRGRRAPTCPSTSIPSSRRP
jgi:two-component system, OmpR family, sensor histidine kinase MtrB